MKVVIKLKETFGSFLFDGNEGNRFRFCEIEPKIALNQIVILDFEGVENMTDSFANACFGNLFHSLDFNLEGKVEFRNCSPLVQDFILSAMNIALMRVHR